MIAQYHAQSSDDDVWSDDGGDDGCGLSPAQSESRLKRAVDDVTRAVTQFDYVLRN